MEMKMESIFKQQVRLLLSNSISDSDIDSSCIKFQAEALKFISMCFANLNEAMEDDQRAFWRNQLVANISFFFFQICLIPCFSP